MRNLLATCAILLALIIASINPISIIADSNENNNSAGSKDTYNDLGIKIGTEVYGEDISKLSEKELQYVPEGWRDGTVSSEHPDYEALESKIAPSASYPNVNKYIKDKKLTTPDVEYNHIKHLTKFPYRGGYGAVEGVVAHETANPNSTIEGEISWMSRNHKNAFVHAFVDHQRIIEVHPTNQAAWGAGRYANERFVHVELVRVKNFDQFARSINNYSTYIASILYHYNLSVTDAENTGKGTLWSHKAVSKHLGGTTHVDPHGYFAKYGYKWKDFIKLVKEKYNEMKVDRIAGKNRYETAVEVSKAGWSRATNVVLARGDEYADALAGATFAKKYKAPLLLTQSSKLTKVTLSEIKRLGAKNVYILGGDKAISPKIESELNKLGYYTRRLAGKNREETALAIANDVLKGKKNSQAAIVNGYEYPDALSVAPYAAQKGIPILLTQPNNVSKATKSALKDLSITKTLVIGGPIAVPNHIEKTMPSPKRIGGQNRFETAVELAKYFNVESDAYYITTGMEFPDALTSSSLASKFETGILLVEKKVPEPVSKFISNRKLGSLTIIGGPVAVNKTVEKSLIQLIK